MQLLLGPPHNEAYFWTGGNILYFMLKEKYLQIHYLFFDFLDFLFPYLSELYLVLYYTYIQY